MITKAPDLQVVRLLRGYFWKSRAARLGSGSTSVSRRVRMDLSNWILAAGQHQGSTSANCTALNPLVANWARPKTQLL